MEKGTNMASPLWNVCTKIQIFSVTALRKTNSTCLIIIHICMYLFIDENFVIVVILGGGGAVKRQEGESVWSDVAERKKGGGGKGIK